MPVICALLGAVLCAQIPLGASAAQNAYDFSMPGGSSVALDASALLGRMGETVGDVEREYLDGVFELLYSEPLSKTESGQPTVLTFYEGDGEGGELRAEASVYRYLASNGSEVVWSPTAATVNGIPMSETDGAFSAQVGDTATDGDTVSVTYETTLTVKRGDVNVFLNSAYRAAEAAHTKLEEAEARYQDEYARYLSAKAQYDRYLAALEQYERDEAEYKQYCSDLAVYESELRRYEAYLAALETYERDLEAYNGYDERLAAYKEQVRAREQYLQALAQYQKQLEAYESAVASPEGEKALHQLDILAYLTRPVTSLKRTLYDAIMGGTVTQVLANSELLYQYGHVEKKALDEAARVTYNLRDLLPHLTACKTDEERYTFYILNSDALRENFCTLWRTLDFLYAYEDYDIVRDNIKGDRKTKFDILLAQLYYFCNAITDGGVPNYAKVYNYGRDKKSYKAKDFDSSYLIAGKTPLSIIGEDFLEDKEMAEPLQNGYPKIPPKPEDPTPVADPGQQPVRPREPVLPEEVKQPTPPETVEPPTMSEREVPNPVEPTPYLPTEEETRLSAAYKTTLFERTPLAEDVRLIFQTSIVKYFRNARLVNVYFHRYERGTEENPVVRRVYEAELFAPVSAGDLAPAKELRGYTCTFAGWEDGDGNLIDLNSLDTARTELDLYPRFTVTPNLYEVVWDVAGSRFSDLCAYQTIPMYDPVRFKPLEKTGGGVRLYRFRGWQCGNDFYPGGEPLAPMSDAPVRYEARFEESHVVTFSVDGSVYEYAVWDGDPVRFEGTPEKPSDGRYYYVFRGWGAEIPAETRADAVYIAQFERLPLIGAMDGTAGTVEEREGALVATLYGGYSEIAVAGAVGVANGRNLPLSVRLSSITVFFDVADVKLFAAEGAATMRAEAIQTGVNAYRYLIALSDGEGSPVAAGRSVDVSASGSFDLENSVLYCTEKDGTMSAVQPTFGKNTVSFAARLSYEHTLFAQYAVSVIESEFAELTIDKMHARAGETVTVTVGEFQPGTYLESLYVRYGNESVAVGDDGTFTMPAGNVVVGLLAGYYEYTVVFRADGKVISTATYRYGEQPVPPADPVKAPDETYEYTFSGWDKPIEKVTKDAEYVAVYTKAELPERVYPVSKLVKIMRVAIVVVPIFLGLLILLIVFLVVRHILKKKRRARGEPPKKRRTKRKTPMPEAPEAAEDVPMPEAPETADGAPSEPSEEGEDKGE